MERLSKTKVKELASEAPKTGFAEIRLTNPKRTGTIVIRDYLVNGIKRPFVDEEGNEKVLRVTRKMMLNLSLVRDQLVYEQVRLHPHYVKGANPILKLVNHEEEDKAFVLQKDLESKANAIIKDLKADEIKDFARVLLIPIKEGSSETAIKRKLYDKVELDPTFVINEWNDDARELKSLLRKGIAGNLFKKKGGVFYFKDQVMGTSSELAIEWLRGEGDDLIPSIRKELGIK